MRLKTYPFSSSKNFLEFAFESHGPKGIIKKAVRFMPASLGGIPCFNLAFGDFTEGVEDLDDRAVPNNGDRNKVLATVAGIVVEFVNHFPSAVIYAQGSTKARTRLYRIMISANLAEVEALMEIYGYYNGEWGQFVKNVNYDAYLGFIKRK